MSSITKQRVGKYTYLYESTSYWVKGKGPRNNKVRIGSIDPVTGEAVYTPEYLARLATEPTSTSPTADQVWRQELTKALDSVKDFGASYFLLEMASNLGLTSALRFALPQHWEKVLALACYLVVSDKAVMYCDDWVSSNDGFGTLDMSSQRTSELLSSITHQLRSAFYQTWHRRISEREYIALDITSVSSYSKQIIGCEWGHNRDGENLPQLNICMLFGETSRLPVYQTIYSGSLNDVSTLDSTLAEFTSLTGEKEYRFVMDKGFYSIQNVNMLLMQNNCKFLLPVPFTAKFALNQIDSESKGIDQLTHVIHTSGAPVRGLCKTRKWGPNDKKVYTHVFYDPEKALKARNELFEKLTRLQEQVLREPDNKVNTAAIKKYLIVRKSTIAPEGFTVNIRKDVVEKVLKTTGWLVLISNHIAEPQETLDIYRLKDVVEKGFLRFKNALNLDRLHVHSDERAENKIFVSFIALILASHIHIVMDKKQLYKRWTSDRLLIVLAKLKSLSINNTHILHPITKEQKDILKAFGVALPSD